MADVTVEFGAQDVGLEKTLNAVQAEMADLTSKITKTGLVGEELQATMKKIAQLESTEKRLKAMGDEASGASPKLDALGKDIKGAGDKSEKMGEQSGVGFGKLAAAVGVGQLAAQAFTAALDASFAAVQGAIKGFTDALNLGGTLADLSASTGESAGNLLLLQRAFDNTGSGADAVGPALAKLQNNIFGAGEDSKSAAAAFGRMGVSMEDMAGKTPTEQLALVASGISGIEDPTARAATAIDIFGKSGAQLLPLLTNFSGEMDEARATVGSLADIMDRRANVFDAVGDRFLIIQQKVRDFAAGILDKALPAIDAITGALSRIDASAIGQNLADAFLGGQNAMKGFQAAVDAISIGQVGLAFKVFWESLKLQAMQTADNIYKNLSAAFQTAGDFLAKTLGTGSGAFALLETGFKILSAKVQEGIFSGLSNALAGMGPLFAKGAETAKYQMETAARSVEMLTTGLGAQVEVVKDQMSEAGAALPQSFQDNYSKIPPLFDGITTQQQKVAALEAEVATAAAKTTEERAAQSAQTDAELAKRQALKDQQAQADAEAKASKAELITLETAVNEAKAAGNTELAKSLEQELKSIKAKEEIAKLTEEYVKTLGVDANEAERLATNFVNAKNAASSIGDRAVTVSITTKVDDTRWKDLLASLAANADPKSVEIALKVTGKDTLNEAYKTLQDMEEINKNYQAALTVTGAKSLEELKANLDGIATPAQAQLAMQITGEDNLKDAVQNLERFTNTHKANLLLESQGFEKMDDFQNQLNGITGEKRTDMILEALGMDNLEEAKSALEAILANNGKTVSVTASVDTAAALASITSLYAAANTTFANPVALNLAGDQSIAAVRTSAEGNFAAPIAFNLDGDKTIQDVRAAAEANFANPISLTMSGSQAANDVYSTVNSAFDTPVTLGVNADTQGAQSDVATLGSPQTFTLNADTAGAQTQVAAMSAPQTARFSVDITGAQSQVAALGAPQTFTLSADTASAEQSVATLGAPQTFTLSADTAAAEAQVASLGGPQTFTLSADTTGAQSQVASLGGPQTVTISADTTAAQTQIASLGAAQTVALDADTSAAAAKVATLSDPISVQIDSNQVQAAVASMQAEITNSFTGGEGGPGGLGGTGGQGGQGGAGGDANADVTSITNILNGWTNILTTIRDRLPQFALGV